MQTQPNPNQTRETLDRLRTVIRELQDYDERFKQWSETVEKVIKLLRGEPVSIDTSIYFDRDGKATILYVKLPGLTMGETTALENFTREWVTNVVSKYLNSILYMFLDELKEYIENTRKKAEELLNQLVDKKYDLEGDP
mgnify:CR=1 FL=1